MILIIPDSSVYQASLRTIVGDAALLHRARSILTALAAVFMRGALVLMAGQSGQAVAAELLIVCAAAAVAGTRSFRPASRSSRRIPRASVYRTVGTTACYIAEMTGAVILFFGSSIGMYVAAVTIVSNFYFMISGSRLLLVGISPDKS